MVLVLVLVLMMWLLCKVWLQQWCLLLFSCFYVILCDFMYWIFRCVAVRYALFAAVRNIEFRNWKSVN